MNTELLGKFSLPCPLCQRKYRQDDFHFVESLSTQRYIFHATCSQCLSSLLFRFDARKNGMACVGIPTDLDFEETRATLGASVSADTVIAAHRSLKRHAGSVRDIL